ncbi:unnamed protein product [Lampetra fluviatilis]
MERPGSLSHRDPALVVSLVPTRSACGVRAMPPAPPLLCPGGVAPEPGCCATAEIGPGMMTPGSGQSHHRDVVVFFFRRRRRTAERMHDGMSRARHASTTRDKRRRDDADRQETTSSTVE